MSHMCGNHKKKLIHYFCCRIKDETCLRGILFYLVLQFPLHFQWLLFTGTMNAAFQQIYCWEKSSYYPEWNKCFIKAKKNLTFFMFLWEPKKSAQRHFFTIHLSSFVHFYCNLCLVFKYKFLFLFCLTFWLHCYFCNQFRLLNIYGRIL